VKELLGIIAALLGFVAYAPYFRDILNGKTKPHPYSWFIWGLTTLFILALQITHGAGPGAYTTATIVLMCFTICLFGIKDGRNDIKFSDTLLLVTALIALVVWLVAKQPTLSMLLLVGADMIGMGPTVRKAWNKPNGETLSTWSITTIRHFVSIFALANYSLLTLANPVAWTLANGAFCILLLLRRRIITGPGAGKSELRVLT
jgi:hypothetical protein